MRVTILDYGAGNLHSLAKAVAERTSDVRVETSAARALEGDVLVLPGVGAFGHAAHRLAPARETLRDAMPGQGVVVDFSGETPVVTDGPYGETKELFGGFFLLDVASKQEAVEWAKRVPAAPGSKIEVRRVPGDDVMPQDNEGSVKERVGSERTGRI